MCLQYVEERKKILKSDSFHEYTLFFLKPSTLDMTLVLQILNLSSKRMSFYHR